jgi:hypothetical protein
LKQLILLISFIFCAWHLHAQKILMKTPNGGEVWAGYSTQRIEWSQSDNIDNIKIEISVDSNKTWKTLVSSYPVSATYFDFEVPGKPSDSCFIRISDVQDPANSSSNYPNSPFKIAQPFVTLNIISSILYGGNAQAVTWNSGGVKYVRLSLSYDGISFFTLKDSLPAVNGYYNWKVPNVTAGVAKLKIFAYDANLTDVHAEGFSIAKAISISPAKFRGGSYDGHTALSNIIPVLNINNAALPDSVNANGVLTVKWNTYNVEKLHVQYSLDSTATWKNLVTNYPASASELEMTVPDTTSKMHIRIVSAEDTTRTSVSKKLYIRSKYLSLQVVNKRIEKNVPVELRWLGVGVSMIKLQYQTVNKAPVNIKTNVNGAQEIYIWGPTVTNDSIRFIITDVNSTSLTDTSVWFVMKNLPVHSAAKFHGGPYDGHAAISTRVPTVTVIQPNNVQWNGSFNYNIEWRSENIDKVNIDYSLDSGTTWKTITTGYPASSAKFDWKTPASTTVKGFVRIHDANDTTVNDINDTAFSILGKSLLLVKDSSPVKKGQPYPITWKQSGVENIKLKYKTGLQSGWTTVKDNVNALQEVFNWVIPNNVSDSLIIGVNDVTDNNIADSFLLSKKVGSLPALSAVKFHGGSFDGHSMRSSRNIILISKPAANEIINSGTTYKITWSTVNISDSIIIQYSVDSGATWTTITSQLATNGEYSWTVPNKLNAKIGFQLKQTADGNLSSNQCLMRAVDPISKEVVGLTPKPFTIRIPGTKFLNLVKFYYVPALQENGKMSGTVVAGSTAKTKVNLFVKSGQASFIGDSLIATKIEKIIIGGFADGDSSYAVSDTAYREICVQPAAPVISSTGNKIICPNDSMQVKSINVFEKYKWTSGDSTAAITIKNTGNYQLQVLVNGCWSAYSDSLKTIKDTTKLPTITVSGDTVFCAGKSVTLTASSAAAYQWLNNNAPVNNGQNKDLTVTASGIYSVRINTSLSCSLTSAAKTVTVNALPVITPIAGPAMIPLNDSAEYISTPAGGVWASANTAILSVSAKGIVKGKTEGKTKIYYSVTNTGNCTSKDSIEITVSAAAALVDITGTQQICAGDTSIYSSSVSGGTWSVSDNSILQMTNAKVKALKAGAVTVSYTVNVNGFMVTRSLAVTVHPLPIISKITVTGDTAFCEGQSAQLKTTSTDKIKWLRNGNLLVNDTLQTLKVTQSGSYFYNAVTAKGCNASSQPQIIIVNANPVVSKITGKTSVTKGDTIVLHNLTAGGVWTTAQPGIASVNNAGIVTGVNLGSSFIKYTVTGNANCSTADSVSVLVKPALTINGALAVCMKDSVMLSASLTGGTWSSSDTSIATVSGGGTVTGKKAGAVKILYTVLYQNLNVITSHDFTVYSLPALTLNGANTVYLGDTIILTASVNGGTWSSASAAVATVSNKGVVTGVALGTSEITYSVTNNFGCSAAQTWNVLVKPVLVLTGKNALCVNDTIHVKANVAGGTWSTLNTSIASVNNAGVVKGINAGDAVITYSVLYAGNVITETFTVKVNPVPAKPIIQITDRTLTSSVTANTYTWYIDGVADSVKSKTMEAKKSGEYKVRVTNGFGCSTVSNGYPILISAADALQYHPNPSKGQFKLQYIMDEPGLLQITIRSVAGKLVYKKLQQQGAGVYTEQINLNVIPGLYYIEMKLTKKEYTRSIMIMR